MTVRHPGIPEAAPLRKAALRWFNERGTAVASIGLRLTLSLAPVGSGDSYEVSFGADVRDVRIAASTLSGLWAGTGEFLRACGGSGRPIGFEPGVRTPVKPMRGMYLATHFNNFYHAADIARVSAYVEDLALLGLDTLVVWFDMHHFAGLSDPAAVRMLARLRAILRAAKCAGMKAGLTLLANEGYADSPLALRADGTAGHDGYHTPLVHYGVEVCPSAEGGMEYILSRRDEFFEAMADVGIDYVCVWPYDQGGCTCSRCAPWGANGFLRVAERVAALARARFPGVKVILSTWDFDVFRDDEWKTFRERFANDPPWADLLLVEPRGEYREFPSKAGEIRGLRQVGFPEISMMFCTPWGGFGANPYPEYLRGIWDVCGDELDGGFAYSEGLFEDVNKFVVSRMYWTGKCDPAAALAEYVAGFFPGAPDPAALAGALAAMERTLPRTRYEPGSDRPHYPGELGARDAEGVRYVLRDPSEAEAVHDVVSAADAALPAAVRRSWRWRIVLLRSRADRELARSGGDATPAVLEVWRELIRIYGSPDAYWWVRPPLPGGMR